MFRAVPVHLGLVNPGVAHQRPHAQRATGVTHLGLPFHGLGLLWQQVVNDIVLAFDEPLRLGLAIHPQVIDDFVEVGQHRTGIVHFPVVRIGCQPKLLVG